MSSPLYVVSGYMRCGTTPMMKALEAGGMNAFYNPKDENCEVPVGISTQWDFPRGLEGRLIKVMGGAAVSMAVMPEGIKIVYMRRDPREIEMSYRKLFGKAIDLKNYERDTDYIIERLGNRKDVKSLTVLNYAAVVSDPAAFFHFLRNNDWPIDVNKAAAVFDPKLYRSKVTV